MTAREYAVIVHETYHSDIRKRYAARVVQGTIERYYPGGLVTVYRPTARWAWKAADRKRRKIIASEERQERQRLAARRATGYDR